MIIKLQQLWNTYGYYGIYFRRKYEMYKQEIHMSIVFSFTGSIFDEKIFRPWIIWRTFKAFLSLTWLKIKRRMI